MLQVWESCKLYVQRTNEDFLDDTDPALSLKKDDVLRQVYYKYARGGGHHPESYRVLKASYERHIEGKHIPFHCYVISRPEEDEEIEKDKPLPSYSRAGRIKVGR